ncbi:hypothetical protein FRB94_011584 [Tulasnella sp. JGI-2019a]|nr:hypothetical protein FRB93_000656 [Tulasnella sp. JGI-2019a]KAG9009728.1 hypothetical protein FRB94_011584 [Tulasnella sp. JGI-2019a]
MSDPRSSSRRMPDWLRLPRRSDIPPLSYSITRDVDWKGDLYVYLVAVMGFIILIPVNYALTGYETVTQASPDYRPVQHHWYDAFTHKSEAPCDSYKFTVGDSFITTPGIFTYQLAYISGDEGTTSTIAYTGQTLEECDVLYMSATADARSQSSTIAAYIACKSEAQFPVVFTTSFRYDSSLTADWLVSPLAFKEVGQPISQNDLFLDVDEAMASASADLVGQVTNALLVIPNSSGPLLVSGEALPIGGYPPWWCTPSLFKTNSTCGIAVPPISLSLRNLYDATGIPILNTTTLPTNYNITINNAMQTILAAIRIDLGNILPNNFLVHRTPDVIGSTISPTIPIQGFQTPQTRLYTLIANSTWLNGHEGLGTLNPDSVSPSQITLEYQCRLKQRKSAGTLFVDVTVATLTLFKSGWGFALWLLILVKLWNKPEKKLCAGNDTLDGKLQELVDQAVEAKFQDQVRPAIEKALADRDVAKLPARPGPPTHRDTDATVQGLDGQLSVPSPSKQG